MIGRHRSRPALLLAAAVLAASLPFTQRPTGLAGADPPRHAAAVAEARTSVEVAASALDKAAGQLEAAIEATRGASANALAGARIEADRFEEAADLARAATAPLADARRALSRLRADCAALGIRGPQLTIDSTRATAVGDAIGDAIDAAAGFIGLRADTTVVLDELSDAAAALRTQDHAAASAAAGRAAAAMERVEPFAVALPPLRLWLETSGDLLATVRDAATAIRDGDRAAAAEAQERLRDAAGEAAVSDRALALATSEGASRVLGSPLQQLAELARDVAEARATVDSVRAALVARAGPGEAP